MKNSCCGEASNCCDNIPDHHMCKMTQPPGKYDLAKVMRLVNNPKFICKCCGRMANESDNLCSPLPMEAN